MSFSAFDDFESFIEAHEFQAIVWDFDGVIKNSVEVKSDCFRALFEGQSSQISRAIGVHHQAHPGMSRTEKIPIYMDMVGIKMTSSNILELRERFDSLCRDAVINSDWVDGWLDVHRRKAEQVKWFLASAAPKIELDDILTALGLFETFSAVFGYPSTKVEALRYVISNIGCDPRKILFVGDAETDWAAADAVGVEFLLVRRQEEIVGMNYFGYRTDHFESEICSINKI